MKIEKGKFYTTRDGRKAEILKTDAKKIYPIVGLITHSEGVELTASWCDNGKHIAHLEEHAYDIISEWKEALDFDPYCLPKWADKWIAMDWDGEWHAYNTKPMLDEYKPFWYNDFSVEGEAAFIPERFHPKNYNGHWKDSLHNVNQLKNKPF